MEQYNATTGSNTRTILEMRVRNHARISAYGYGIASIELRAGLGGQNRAYCTRVALGPNDAQLGLRITGRATARDYSM